ncbi:MAG: hypothetical protein ACLQQ4_10550 [Bacteroidia bacterium]
MSYFKPEITYTNKFYKTKCQIVASGILMYKDVAGYRERKTFHVVEADNGNYYLVNLNEQSIEKAGFVEAGGNS